MRGAKIRKKTPRTAFRLLCLHPPGSASPHSRPSSLPPFLAPALRSVCPAPRFPPLRSLPAAPCFRPSVSPYFPFPPCPALPPASPRPPSGRVENGKTKAEGPKTLRRFPCLPLPAARYSIRSVNSRVWGGVQTWSSQLCQPTVQVAVPVPLPLTGSVSVTSFS